MTDSTATHTTRVDETYDFADPLHLAGMPKYAASCSCGWTERPTGDQGLAEEWADEHAGVPRG